MNTTTIKACLVAILKDEQRYLDEWIIYHRMIGIDHFYLYDNDPLLPLEEFIKPYKSYVTVIPWPRARCEIGKGTNQIQAYTHALNNVLPKDQWVTFLDADEFLVFKKHSNISDFLSGFSCSSISLNWHVFGHNGYFDDPKDLITSSLVRRKRQPSAAVKSITKVNAIKKISSPHFCELNYGIRVDANNKYFTPEIYEDKTLIAHVNHYQCRSFSAWMRRTDRGDVNFSSKNCPHQHQWRLTKEQCLRKFVTTVALDKNEHLDESMVVFKKAILSQKLKISRNSNPFYEHRSQIDSHTATIERQLVSIATIIKSDISKIKDVGLLYGKSGAALFLSYYGEYSKNRIYTELAIETINNSFDKADNSPSDYVGGIAGFGVTVEFLIQKGLLEIDADKALGKVDKLLSNHISSRSTKSANLFTGLTGIGRYFVFRLKSQLNDDENIRNFNSTTISKILTLLQIPYVSFFDILSVVDFISSSYSYLQEKKKALQYLGYAIDKLETMVYEDAHFENPNSQFNPLNTALCFIKASQGLENPNFLRMANECLKRHEKDYYKKLINNRKFDMFDWLLYYHLYSYYKDPDYLRKALACLTLCLEANRMYLEECEYLNSYSIKKANLWALGMSLLTVVHSRDADWINLLLPWCNLKTNGNS